MAALFQLGDFTLSSGRKSAWKIDCDALEQEDIATLAKLIADMVGLFSTVEGVPRGGLRLAEALWSYIYPGESKALTNRHLIVDDVWTTGNSMKKIMHQHWSMDPEKNLIGAVVFARGIAPSFVKPLFQMPKKLF